MSQLEHSPLGFSVAERRVGCPGSLELESHYPNPDTEANRTGTAAHDVLEHIANGLDVEAGKLAKNGELITDEMIAGAYLLLGDVDKTLRDCPEAATCIVVEKKVAAPQIHPDNWGTPDLWVYIRTIRTLIVWEYKFGFGYVDAVRNYQLLNQGLAILGALDIPQEEKDEITFVLKVVQPRFYGGGRQIRKWIVPANEKYAYQSVLIEAYRLATSGNAPLKTGPHCIDCKAVTGCQAIRKSLGAFVEFTDLATNLPLDNVSLAVQKSIIDSGYDRLKYVKQALDLEVESRLRAGESVPGNILKPGRTAKVWTAPAEEVANFGDLMGVNLRKPVDVKTPTQVINEKYIPADLLSGMWDEKPGALKLAILSESQVIAAFTNEQE